MKRRRPSGATLKTTGSPLFRWFLFALFDLPRRDIANELGEGDGVAGALESLSGHVLNMACRGATAN